MKCRNCGAELKYGKCEYCGSVFNEEPYLETTLFFADGEALEIVTLAEREVKKLQADRIRGGVISIKE